VITTSSVPCLLRVTVALTTGSSELITFHIGPMAESLSTPPGTRGTL